jgi:hypothetical protein
VRGKTLAEIKKINPGMRINAGDKVFFKTWRNVPPQYGLATAPG